MDSIEINGKTYTLGVIKTGPGRKMQKQYPDPSDYNVAFLAASLKSGGLEEATPEWVDENIDFYPVVVGGQSEFLQLLNKALEANGVKIEAPKPGGEVPAEAAATELTSDISTAA